MISINSSGKTTAEDEAELRCWMPEPATLPSPDDFDKLVAIERAWQASPHDRL